MSQVVAQSHTEILRSMANDCCPILGTRQPEARAAQWALDEIDRLRDAPCQAVHTVTLDDLKLFADAACELDALNGYVDPDCPAETQRIRTLIERAHAAIERIAGPDAGEIYAQDDGSIVEQS